MMWLLAQALVIIYGAVVALMVFYVCPKWMQGE